MDQPNSQSATSALLALLRSTLSADGTPGFGQLVLYTSFGVVRGRLGYAFAQRLIGHNDSPGQAEPTEDLIELNDAKVEHYSNHLATASFDRLYVKATEVQGFALVDGQSQ